jgi:cell division protease FtsH
MTLVKRLLIIGSLALVVPHYSYTMNPDGWNIFSSDLLKKIAIQVIMTATAFNAIVLCKELYTKWSAYKERTGIKNNIPSTRFSDVAGVTTAKEELQDLIHYLEDPSSYTSLGATPPKGFLLYGPPGTGKTLLARATAGECGCQFLNICGTEFVDKYVGTGASVVRALFAQARASAPCIIFIDEIDVIGQSRGYQESDSGEYAATLNQLLSEMDGFNTFDKPIIVIAATNKIELLDDALLRPGRLDKKIYIPLPALSERLDILTVHARKIILDASVDLVSLAQATAGFSGADLAELLRDAARIATRLNKTSVEQEDIAAALDTIIVGAENKTLTLTHAEKKQIAYHESGHALMRLLLKNYGTPLHKITLLPRGNTLGTTWSLPERDRHTYNKDELEAEIAILLGGRVAEELVFESISTGAYGDFRRATGIAEEMVCDYGMSSEIGMVAYTHRQPSPKTADMIEQAIRTVIDKAYAQAKNMLTDNIDKLHILAYELLEKETLSAEEIYTLLDIRPDAQLSTA